ncbi:hypothetical protein PIB30_002082 [Stylosanthes scabra]|uniref:Uncharacterized protein n=1 Tax=Stylosanthes scabra TaxID=79078 RepID=A0ABU6R1Z0_9FABA|nr:hypothetical protein [Stylosanthes scabra]
MITEDTCSTELEKSFWSLTDAQLTTLAQDVLAGLPPPFLGNYRTAFEILCENRAASALSEYYLILRDPPLKNLGLTEHWFTSTPEH